MVTSAILELAIGVVFVWLLFSLALSAVNDALALVFRIRAKQLWLAVGRVLEPSTTRQARRFWDTIVRLPFSRDNYDVRPRSSESAADDPVRAAKTPTETGALQRKLQNVYDRLAPNLTDVALRGRRSKLTSLPTDLLAGAVARLATSVFPADLVAQSNLPQPSQPVWNLEQRTTRDRSRPTCTGPEGVARHGPERLRPFKHVLTAKWISSPRATGARAEKYSAFSPCACLATNANAVGLVQQLHRDANLRQVVSASVAGAAETDLRAVTSRYCTPPTLTSPPASPTNEAAAARETNHRRSTMFVTSCGARFGSLVLLISWSWCRTGRHDGTRPLRPEAMGAVVCGVSSNRQSSQR